MSSIANPTSLPTADLTGALLVFYHSVMAHWAAPGNAQKRGAALKASDDVHRLLYPDELIGGMPLGGQSL